MHVPLLDLRLQYEPLKAEILSEIEKVADSQHFVLGPQVERLETAVAKYCGAAHTAGASSGTDAQLLLMMAMGIGPGDAVITTPFTFFATAGCIARLGAKPVFADIDPATYNISCEALGAALAETANVKAIVPVHLFGCCAEMDGILRLASRYGVQVLEDAAQALGASHPLGGAGSIGDGGWFSFYPTKNLGALGDAGGITTDDASVAATVRSRRSYGQGRQKYEHVDTGWNSRLDPLQAAFLMVHLARLDGWTQRRRAIASVYQAGLQDVLGATVAPQTLEGSVWHHFVVRASDRTGLRATLAEAGVGTDVHYPYSIRDIDPLRPRVRYVDRELSRAAQLGAQVVSLPMGPWMSDAQVEHVAAALRGVDRRLLAAD